MMLVQLHTLRKHVQLLRDIDQRLSPFNAQQFLIGLETLHLRTERHSENAQKVAEFLENHEKVSQVNYPGLKSNQYHELATKYLPNGQGAILTFGVKGNSEAIPEFVEALNLFSLLANVGDSKSLIIHPKKYNTPTINIRRTTSIRCYKRLSTLISWYRI